MIMAVMMAGWGLAAQIAFDGAWQVQNLPLKKSVQYAPGGATLGITADSAVSVLFRPLPESLGDARRARWSWRFDQSVPATDLTRKGGDDRNASLYFIFAPRAEAAKLRGLSARKVLGNPSIRAVLYVHGGAQSNGTRFQSPYLQGRGLSIISQSAGTGASSVDAPIRDDFNRAYGAADDILIGVAITSDSDDTKSVIKGAISNLIIE